MIQHFYDAQQWQTLGMDRSGQAWNWFYLRGSIVTACGFGTERMSTSTQAIGLRTDNETLSPFGLLRR